MHILDHPILCCTGNTIVELPTINTLLANCGQELIKLLAKLRPCAHHLLEALELLSDTLIKSVRIPFSPDLHPPFSLPDLVALFHPAATFSVLLRTCDLPFLVGAFIFKSPLVVEIVSSHGTTYSIGATCLVFGVLLGGDFSIKLTLPIGLLLGDPGRELGHFIFNERTHVVQLVIYGAFRDGGSRLIFTLLVHIGVVSFDDASKLYTLYVD